VNSLLARTGRALLFRFRDTTSRIEWPLFWRLFYRLLETRAAIGAVAAGSRLAARFGPGIAAEDILTRLSHLFLTGWPHHRGTPWINLNVSRFYWKAVQRTRGSRPRPLRPARHDPERLRIGVLANLSATLTFIRPFFENLPGDVDVVAFDLAGPEQPAEYLPPLISGYHALSRKDMVAVSDAIEQANLDILLFDVYKADVYAMLDRITTPCIVDLGTTPQFVFHPDVAFRLYYAQQAEYLLRDGGLFCATSRSSFGPERVVPCALLFETRGLDRPPRRTWAERDPLLVYHGKLYKASAAYLDTVFGLLEDDDALEFVAMGRDSDGALARMQAAARQHGVAARFHSEGEFRLTRNADGEIDDPSWLKLAEYLRRARLAPDPWPLPGGYSRVEAYTAGAPVAHMGIRTDPGSWSKPQPAVTAEHPALIIPSTTAYSSAEYGDIARRLLHDAEFADEIAAEQVDLAARVTDPTAFWAQILAGYRTWLGAGYTGTRAASSERGL
jgi:hypothetical protein